MASFFKKGMTLFIVIGVVMVVGILAIAVLRLMLNHGRLTHHQVSRIQGQYAAKAGVIYALDMLRRNDDASWSATTPVLPVEKTMCRAITAVDPLVPECDCTAPDVTEPYLPALIKCVNITVYDSAAASPNQGLMGTRKVSATAVFTYTPD